MLKVVIPDSEAKLQKQIQALRWQLQHDTNDKDKQIHKQALKELTNAY